MPPALPRPEGAPDKAIGDNGRMVRNGWQRLVNSILDCEKPVIAQVQATAAGGGMHLALACDVIVAAESATFVEAFVRRGIAPDAAGAWLLTRLVGLTKAKELFFFGDALSATEAARLGMVTKVVPDDELEAVVNGLAERLAEAPTRALAITKFLTNRALDVDRTQALHDEAMGQELVTYTEDMKEGIAAFVERRTPHFRGW